VSRESEGFASRMFDFCVGILLAVMALYGAVSVLEAIWVPLCIAIFVVITVALAIWFFIVRARRF
jgi:hypothetical protein